MKREDEAFLDIPANGAPVFESEDGSRLVETGLPWLPGDVAKPVFIEPITIRRPLANSHTIELTNIVDPVELLPDEDI